MATATYPPPPPYYKLYNDYLQDPKSAPDLSPPIEGTHICYGSNYTMDDVLPSLEEQGVHQLYPKGPNVGPWITLKPLRPKLAPKCMRWMEVLEREVLGG